MDTFITRVMSVGQVVIRAILTWLIIIASTLTYLAEQIQPIAETGDEPAQAVLAWVLRIVGGIAVVLTAIKRHTPVTDPALQGITGPAVQVVAKE